MSAKPTILSPTKITEQPFPGIDQAKSSSGDKDSATTYIPTEITDLDFEIPNIATGLHSSSINTSTRTINSNFSFQPLGAISIGTVRGTGISLSGSGIRISPYGIYGYTNGVTTFALDGTNGSLSLTGFIQVGGAAADINAPAHVTRIEPGKVWIGNSSTPLSSWSAGGDATFIDGGKLYTGTVTADTVRASWVYAGTLTAGQVNAVAINADSITTGTLTGRTVQSSTGNDRVVLDNGNYIRFYAGGNLKASMRGTTAGVGGVYEDGDFFLANNRSYYITSTSGGANEYGGLSVTNGNQLWITLGTANTFYIKNNAQNDNYFTVSNDRAYHRAEIMCNKFTSLSGELQLDPEGSNKIACYNNLDLKNNNIDECTTIWAYNFNNRSDISLKKDITDRTDSLAKIKQLRPIDYLLKDETKSKPNNLKRIGLIAQEVEQILPEVVMSDENGIKGINYNELIPIIIGAIKELEAKISP
jgi:hypothetical protein